MQVSKNHNSFDFDVKLSDNYFKKIKGELRDACQEPQLDISFKIVSDQRLILGKVGGKLASHVFYFLSELQSQ